MYHQPTTVDEVLGLKHQLGAAASFLAGGTDLVVGVRKGRREFGELIDLSRVDALAALERSGDTMRIGSMCRLATLERSGVDALAAACETVGGPQIRNLGTVGGQLGTASPAGDVSIALLALDAEVELASAETGTRSLPLAELFVGPGRTVLAEHELITAVTIPTNRRSAFYKIGKRGAVAISVVMAAASLGPEGELGIALGCVAPTPLRARKAEAHLQGGELSDARIDEAAALAAGEVKPIDDHRGGADYRRAMAATITRRLLRQLCDLPSTTSNEAPA